MVLWNLYCLPGRIIAHLEYLFPGRGQLWASGRRKDSVVSHFIFATLFYALVLYLAINHSKKVERLASTTADSGSQYPAPESAEQAVPKPAPDAAGLAIDSQPEGSHQVQADIADCERLARINEMGGCPTDAMQQAGWSVEAWRTRKSEIYGQRANTLASDGSTPVEANSSPEVTPSVITNPDWLRKPNADDVARYYPDDLQKAGADGSAMLSCTVNARGDLINCEVASEAPGGYGVGDAALRLSKLFRMRPMTLNGQPVTGGVVRIPIRFRTNQGEFE